MEIQDLNGYRCKNHTIGLEISINGLPDKVNVNGEILLKRSSFHVSLVCIGKIIEKHKITNLDFEKLIIDDFIEYTKTKKIELANFLNEFRFVKELEEKSLVIMCEVVNLKEFFGLINLKYGLKIEYQPTHVTIFTLHPDIGIFLTNQEDLKNLSQIVNPELDKNIFKL